jgi:hypothetical protein
MADCADKEEIRKLRAEVGRLRARINRLTPRLSVMLRQRGFTIYKKEPPDDLLVPENPHIDSYYEMLKKYSFRLFLRDIIKHQPVFTLAQATRYATREVTAQYIGHLIKTGMVMPEGDAYRLLKGPIRSFGTTLEWFVAEIFRKEFSAEAVWGVKIRHRTVGGDFDLLSKIEGAILYMEIKSSPPRQIYQNEIASFFDRVEDLMPEIAIFFMDTELRMKDKIVPLFEEELRCRFVAPPGVRRIEKELFEVSRDGTKLPEMFIINAKDSIISNIVSILARHFRGGTHMKDGELCIVCAWRSTCQKKFSMKAGHTGPDYCKDLTLREPSSTSEGTKEEK